MHRSAGVFAALLATCLVPSHAVASEQNKESPKQAIIKVKEMNWDGWLGGAKGDRDTVYSLLGCSWLGPGSPENLANFKSLVQEWLKQHPNATATPVFSWGPLAARRPETKFTWVWVSDGAANLNEYLVRQGACSLQHMQIPGPMSATIEGLFWKSGLLVSRQAYQRFLETAKKAEQQTQKNGLGNGSVPFGTR